MKKVVTNRRTNQQSDVMTDNGPTDTPSYRDAWTHLKISDFSLSVLINCVLMRDRMSYVQSNCCQFAAF